LALASTLIMATEDELARLQEGFESLLVIRKEIGRASPNGNGIHRNSKE
jgi:hypothetical protein